MKYVFFILVLAACGREVPIEETPVTPDTRCAHTRFVVSPEAVGSSACSEAQ